MKELEIFEIL